MKNQEMIRGIEAIQSVCSAYQALKGRVKDEQQFQKAANYVLSQILQHNSVLHRISDTKESFNNPDRIMLGSYSASIALSEGADEPLAPVFPSFPVGKLSFPLELDLTHGFTLLLEKEASGEFSSTLSQYLLLTLLRSREVVFRCADLVTSGHFFSFLYHFIQESPEKSGGKIAASLFELDAVLHFLEDASMHILSTLGGGYTDLFSYNAANQVKLPTYAAVICLPADCRDETLARLRVLSHNAEKTGIVLILVSDHTIAEKCRAFADYHCICTANDMNLATTGDIVFQRNPAIALSDDMLADAKEKLNRRGVIDTLYEHHPELNTEYMSMDSTSALRIPFAVDKDGIVQYFELGGDAPAHALISGSTGSGKSVALHTMIMQIVRNYHPDDVEIWAIDYKAVEFNSYIDHHSPHFRVVGHDSSDEFSFSLLDLLNEEYERRRQLFLENNVNNIAGYRKKMGLHSMPRIIVFIDEFQIMTQAVQNYQGGNNYKTILENLLRLTRAMGISFVLCSQTIASGLAGLTEGARDQIGCRLSLKHDDDNEIRETLRLSGDEASEIVQRAKNLKKGQAIYKRSLLSGETSKDGKSYVYKDLNIFYMSDSIKDGVLDAVTEQIGDDYAPKMEVFVRGGGRISLTERVRHPMQRFLRCDYEPKEECLEWYPAAPTTLADDFCVELEKNEGSNILLVGEDDDLRESVAFHSLCGFLMNPNNTVIASFVDENYSDRARMIGELKSIHSRRLTINIGLTDTLNTLSSLQKIRPNDSGNIIYLWYGLDKLKNEIFLRDQDREEVEETEIAEGTATDVGGLSALLELQNFLAQDSMNSFSGAKKSTADGSELTYDDCRRILLQLFEDGPENGHFSFVIFNNVKAMKKSKCLNPESFEHKIGTKMTNDDSYELFGSSLAANKADGSTVVYDAGSAHTIPLRPYLMPTEDWVDSFSLLLDI